MNARPSTNGKPRALTFAALAFALVSIAWSVFSIRQWLAEHRESELAELSESREGRGRRNREFEPPEERGPTPTKALAALASRQPTVRLTNAAALFNLTSLWTVHLQFTPEQWAALEPRQTVPRDQARSPDGRPQMRNPAANRNGLAGMRGIEFEWVHAGVEFEDRAFADAAVRYKGNGTYMRSQQQMKRPFKVDLNKFTQGAELAGRTTLNFGNLAVDDSCLHDALAYEVFRAAGVPAPRTAYARLFVTTNAAPPEYLGVYVLVENVDEDFAAERFGTRQGAVFKPVTTDLFSDLGDDWSAYHEIYDPKNRLTSAQSDRVIEFAGLVTEADDATFAARVGEFVELDEFARFLSVLVLLSSYDSFLDAGQNYCLWLSPETRQFHFIPWDLDNAWGKFRPVGSTLERAHASIMHPWIGQHRLLERIMAVPSFQIRYRQTLEELLDRVFVPEPLHRRVDELAALLRPVVAEEAPRKFARFEQAVTATRLEEGSAEGGGFGRNRPPHPLKWFITERAKSVREQLAGESEGVRLERWR